MECKSRFSCARIVGLRGGFGSLRGLTAKCDAEPRFKCQPGIVDNQLGKSSPSTSTSREICKVRPASSEGWR